MRNRKPLPHARLRAAIFWILIATWPVFRVAEHLWHPDWYADAEDIAASLTVLAFLLGKVLWHDTQRKVCRRLEEVEQRVHGYDEALTQFCPEPVSPSLAVVRDDTSATKARPSRRAARGAFARRGSPR